MMNARGHSRLREMTMKFISVLASGLALGAALIGSAAAQDSGGAAPVATGAASDQGGINVDTLFAPKGKGARGTGTGLNVPSVGKLQAQPPAGPRPPATGTTIRDFRPGTPTDKPPATSGGVAVTSQSLNRASASAGVGAATTGGPNINGTAMVRPATGAAAVGGSTKSTGGVLSGNSFSRKHP